MIQMNKKHILIAVLAGLLLIACPGPDKNKEETAKPETNTEQPAANNTTEEATITEDNAEKEADKLLKELDEDL